VAPDEGGEKPYALLFQALRESKYYALAKVAMHNREHIIVLRPGAKGILSHTMYYQDEIRQVEEFRTDTSLVKDKELAMAKMLISSLEAEFEPQKYQDRLPRESAKDDRIENSRSEGGGHAGDARGAGHRHHGSAEKEPGGETQARERGHGGGWRGRRRGNGGGRAGKSAPERQADTSLVPRQTAGMEDPGRQQETD